MESYPDFLKLPSEAKDYNDFYPLPKTCRDRECKTIKLLEGAYTLKEIYSDKIESAKKFEKRISNLRELCESCDFTADWRVSNPFIGFF